MRVQRNVRSSFIVGVAAFIAAAAGLACYEGPHSFQPVTDGAKPWSPPPGWDPQPTCATGYYVAIRTCDGCSGISYALCVGISFSQCACGGPFWPGAECPKFLVCESGDFPPYNWLEFTAYAGPGWAGQNVSADAGH
jgi:hypothetical protein